jgi:hypothetical protein
MKRNGPVSKVAKQSSSLRYKKSFARSYRGYKRKAEIKTARATF